MSSQPPPSNGSVIEQLRDMMGIGGKKESQREESEERRKSSADACLVQDRPGAGSPNRPSTTKHSSDVGTKCTHEKHLVERQRRLTPFNDFSSASLLPTDPKPLSWAHDKHESVAFINPNEWELVRVDDPDGWEYAFNFGFKLSKKCSASDFVRVRRWMTASSRSKKEGSGSAAADALARGMRDLGESYEEESDDEGDTHPPTGTSGAAAGSSPDKIGLGRAVAAACVAERESFVSDVLGEGTHIEDKSVVGAELASAVVKMIGGLRNATEDNLHFFSSTAIKWKDFSTLCVEILVTITALEDTASKIAALAFLNDAGDVHGNGYWSLLRVLHCCLRKLRAKVVNITSERDSVFFGARSSHLHKATSQYYGILKILVYTFSIATSLSEPRDETPAGERAEEDGTLLERRVSDWGTPVDEKRTPSEQGSGGHEWHNGLIKTDIGMEDIEEMLEGIDLSVLYDEKFGYQYPIRLRHFLRVVLLATASFSQAHEAYQGEGMLTKLAATYFHGLRYFVQPTKKANRITQQYTAMDITFVKTFWNLTELPIATKFSVVVAAHLEVIRVITVDCTQTLRVPRLVSDGGGEISVSIGGAGSDYGRYIGDDYTPPANIATRLLCMKARQGHEETHSAGNRILWKSEPLPPSRHLIIHFHGGGFIAQSSASHEIYLRDWAKCIDAPIFSVDYSLAPEHPFPVAVDQCFFAYCWAIQNCSQLGSTAESIICVGDSAGANLATVVALRAAEEGIRRPTGVIAIYPALFLSVRPSPSRVLSIMDPLLPLGNLQVCINAYCAKFRATHPAEIEDMLGSQSGVFPGLTAQERKRIHHLSPLLAPDALLKEMPTLYIMAAELDPLLDDSVTFVRRLNALGRGAADGSVHYRVMSRLPHGWLNMYFIGDKTSLAASTVVIRWIKDLMKKGVRSEGGGDEIWNPNEEGGGSAQPSPQRR